MKTSQKDGKIYSRSRINIPRIFFYNKGNKKQKIRVGLILKLITIIIIGGITATIIIKSINPILEKLCIDEAKNIATKISNDETTNVMNKYTYDDLISITKDELRQHNLNSNKC